MNGRPHRPLPFDVERTRARRLRLKVLVATAIVVAYFGVLAYLVGGPLGWW